MSKVDRILLLIVIVTVPLSIMSILLMLGFAGEPWTNIFIPPSSFDGRIYFIVVWVITLTPWIIMARWIWKNQNENH